MHPRIRERVTQLRAIVKEVVDASDPMRLWRHEAPEDEYDPEIDAILGVYVRVGPDPDALTRAVQSTFDRFFGAGRLPLAESRFIATRLCDLWPEDLGTLRS